MTSTHKPFQVLTGDCLDVMRQMPDASFDAVVTDPPYGLSFMGKAWDKSVPSVEVWREALRVLKPGGHLLAFAGTRTQHRMAVNIEDAGFEIRDLIAWVYGSGFPKSLDVSKALDKAAGAERTEGAREWVGGARSGGISHAGAQSGSSQRVIHDAPATPAARQWSGWGTAMKPALEPITVARKPFSGTVAQNVLEHGTGGLNVDGCRVGTEVHTIPARTGGVGGVLEGASRGGAQGGLNHGPREAKSVVGRWPANLIHDGSDEVTELFPGEAEKSAARFFYCPKTSKRDRDDGLDHLPDRDWSQEGACVPERGNRPFLPSKNTHPTVKPTDLMRYLCRLVTPPGGLILDPFMGSGSTGRGAVLEGFRFTGIELDPAHVLVAEARILAALNSLEEGRDAA